MALFKPKTQQQQQEPQFDAQAFEQRMLQQMQTMLQPLMTGLSTLAQQVQAVQRGGQEQESDGDNPSLTRTASALSEERVREIFSELAPSVERQYMPRGRVQAMRRFIQELTPQGKELFDKYQDAVEAVMDNVEPGQQSNPDTYMRAFKFVMTDHMDEYMKATLDDLKPEELPPHLQSPSGGAAGQTEPEIQLSEEEKEIQPIFDRTYKGGFNQKQMREFGDLNKNFNLTMDAMINQAKEKGLIANANAATTTDQGNNA